VEVSNYILVGRKSFWPTQRTARQSSILPFSHVQNCFFIALIAKIELSFIENCDSQPVSLVFSKLLVRDRWWLSGRGHLQPCAKPWLSSPAQWEKEDIQLILINL
jgi:hypothetical protein